MDGRMNVIQYLYTGRWLRLFIASTCVGSLLIYTSVVWAESFLLTVKVTVVTQTCDIYGNEGLGQPISVDMGDIIIKNIDGKSYGKTDIPYSIECDNTEGNPALKLKFDGVRMAGQAANVLKTSEKNMGLRLLADDTNLNLATWYYFNYATRPVLSVVPISSGVGGVNNGSFTASATLSLEYE